MRSLHDRVPGRCNGLKWVKEKQERGKDTGHHWKDKFKGCITCSVRLVWEECEP